MKLLEKKRKFQERNGFYHPFNESLYGTKKRK